MGGGGRDPGIQEANEANAEARRYAQDMWNPYINLAWGNVNGAQQRDAEFQNDIRNGYNTFLSPNYDPFGGYRGMFEDYANTGGFSAEGLASLRGAIGDMRGGIGDYAENRMRGGGVFDEFAETGGMSDKEYDQMVRRGAEYTPAYYDAIQSQLGNQYRAAGSSNPGYSAQSRQMARDASREGAMAALESELGVNRERREGRMWGAEGMATSEGALQNLLFGRENAALGAELGLESSIASNRGQGIGMLGDMTLAGDANRLGALSGLTSLYGTTPAETAMWMDMWGRGIGGATGAERDYANNFQYSNQRGNSGDGWDTAMNAGSGAAATFGGPWGMALAAALQGARAIRNRNG